MVVIRPCSIPKESSRTLATGAREFVVQDALEITCMVLGSYVSSFTPRQNVPSAWSEHGAEMITFFAPALRCRAASSRFVNFPVHSKTTSTFNSLYGSVVGSFDAVVRIFPYFVASMPSLKHAPPQSKRP